MSKRRFNETQAAELLKNKNVAKCSDKSITYSKEFKVRAVKQYYEDGYSPGMIFKEAGFDWQIIGPDSPKDCLQRWRTIYKARGVDCLSIETRGKHHKGGRPKINNMTDAERIKRLEIENAYLKAENDFLAKLRAARKRQN
jgi:transposase-like protein